uniref:Uncharacterized protein n=1 Tax=Anguilla anguilla TaxID=7936 RepID=A0A0E9XWG9_ANGAN
MILLRFWMDVRSRFCSLSSKVCQTEGKGVGMRWRIRTPLFRKGLWSSTTG